MQANVNDPKIYREANADYEAFWGKYSEELVVEPGRDFLPNFHRGARPFSPLLHRPDVTVRARYMPSRYDTPVQTGRSPKHRFLLGWRR